MKIETKKKIIKWVMNMLNYSEYMNPAPNWKVVEKKIMIARAEMIYPKHEIKLISDDQIRFGLNFRLIDELMANNAIAYTQENVEYPEGGMKARAVIKYILP